MTEIKKNITVWGERLHRSKENEVNGPNGNVFDGLQGVQKLPPFKKIQIINVGRILFKRKALLVILF